MRSRSPPFKGRGWGWGLYIFNRQEVTDPTPAPPLEGRGAAAPCISIAQDFFKWTQGVKGVKGVEGVEGV